MSAADGERSTCAGSSNSRGWCATAILRNKNIHNKVPLDAYLAASQTEHEQEKEQQLKEHARHLRMHIASLGKKGYWKHIQPSPEFAVLFLPTEVVLHAALDLDPLLIEWSMEQGVVLATPATLIGMLKAIAYGWKQESLSADVAKISDLGHELYKRIVDMATHFGKVGKNLQSAVKSYNDTIGSLEARVLVTARKFKDLGAASSSLEIEQSEPIELQTRIISSSEVES
jgi:DNA recombination protein RmuC